MEVLPVIKEEFYAWVAADGAIQFALMSTDYVSCLAIAKLMYKAKICESPHTLRLKGFEIKKIELTAVEKV